MTRGDCKAGKMKKYDSGKIRQRILMVIAGLILGLNLFQWNASALGGNELPMPFGTGAAVVLSGSMSPTLEINDVIIVHKEENYKVGDMIVFQSGHELIVHRIIEMEGDKILTKGDANNVADTPIEVRDIKGKVIAHIPAVGLAVKGLKTPMGVLIVLIAAFALTELSFRKEKEEDEKELEEMKAEIRRLKEEQEGKE